MAKVAIIGLGNILMRDEGLGVWAVRALQEGGRLPPEVEVVDGGTTGLDLLPYIEGRDLVIFVDAVNFNREPGYIGILEDRELPAFFGVKGSLHHLGLMDVLAAAQLLNRSPGEICLVGMQPYTLATGLGLSEGAQARLPAVVDCILARLAARGLFPPCSP